MPTTQPKLQPPRYRPWFSDEEAGAVRDLWSIYQHQLEKFEPEPLEASRSTLERAAQRLDFREYEALLARWGERSASLGVAQEREPSGQLLCALAPQLVAAYQGPRLQAALAALGKFLSRRAEAFLDAYDREHERRLTESHQRLRRLAESLESSREEERTRIARELHDELAQQLTAIRMDLGWLVPRLKQAPSEVQERLEAMDQLVETIFNVVRRIGLELRPGILDDLGLPEALQWQASEFERRSGIAVELDTSGEPGPMGRAMSTALFRIFQEILTNVARHAAASHVFASLSVRGESVTLDVTDDGRGIRPEELDSQSSLGLLGMRERATLHGGTFHIGPGHDGGTAVSVTLPWAEATRA